MLLLVYRSCFCQYKKKQSIIKVWKCILKPHIYNIFSIRLLWKVIQHAKFPWIWRSLPINYRIVCTFFFSFYYFMHFYSRQSNFIQNKEQQEEERAEQRKKKVPQMWRNKNKIKSKWNNIQVLFLLFSKHQFQHSSSDTEQLSTSVFIAPAVIMLFCFVSATRSLSRGS